MAKLEPRTPTFRPNSQQNPVPSTRSELPFRASPTKFTTASPGRRPSRPKPKSRRPVWRWLFLSFIVLLVVFGIITYTRISSFTQQTFGGRNENSLLDSASTNASPIAAPAYSASSIAGKIQRGERFSLLILGYGGPGHDGPYLSDTILQLVYDP